MPPLGLKPPVAQRQRQRGIVSRLRVPSKRRPPTLTPTSLNTPDCPRPLSEIGSSLWISDLVLRRSMSATYAIPTTRGPYLSAGLDPELSSCPFPAGSWLVLATFAIMQSRCFQ